MSMGQGHPSDLFKHFSVRDWLVVGGGFVVFVFSFFGNVGFTLPVLGISGSINAWHSFSILGLLLVLTTSVLWALRAGGRVNLPPMPAQFELVSACAAGLGTLLILIRDLTYAGDTPGVSVGLRFGGVVVILAGIAVTVGAAWSHHASGGSGSSGRSSGSGSTGFGGGGTGRFSSGAWKPPRRPPPPPSPPPPSVPPAASWPDYPPPAPPE